VLSKKENMQSIHFDIFENLSMQKYREPEKAVLIRRDAC
jgi:hypothetical protein